MTDRRCLPDYHLHTAMSIDSKMSMEEACRQAIALGLDEICFTEHVDFIPEDEGCGFFDPGSYFQLIERCREEFDGRMTVRAGIEIGEAHRFADEGRELTASNPFDFVIGSLHWVGPDLVMTPDYFVGKSLEQAYGAYFDELLALVRVGDFDIVGHLDVPKRYAGDLHERFDPRPFEDRIRPVLQVCVERGIGIEINTGTIRKTGNDPSPSIEVLNWYRELGGEILTIGSDAHRPEDMAYGFDQARAMVREAGFTHLTTFQQRRSQFVRLD